MTWSRFFFQRDQLHGQLWMIQDKLNWLVSLDQEVEGQQHGIFPLHMVMRGSCPCIVLYS